jgi:hypothetical protein
MAIEVRGQVFGYVFAIRSERLICREVQESGDQHLGSGRPISG